MKLARVRIWRLLVYLAIFPVGQAVALEQTHVTLVFSSPHEEKVIVELHKASVSEERFARENFLGSYDQYIKKMDPEVSATIAPPKIYMAVTDLGGSQSPIYVVVIESAVTCGTAGCSLAVWKKQKDSWVRVASGSNTMPLAVPDADVR